MKERTKASDALKYATLAILLAVRVFSLLSHLAAHTHTNTHIELKAGT